MESGVEEPLSALTVCVDLYWQNSQYVFELLLRVPGNQKEFNLLTETIPEEGAQRENALTRIRTEIMAGKGPDVFICNSSPLQSGKDGLFLFPRQAMENRIFLPLDDYIAQAEQMEWDRLQPQVMEAGRNEEGQLLVPLTYEIGIKAVEKSGYTPSFDRPSTWEEMAESSDPTARELARNVLMYDPLGDLADYENDTLAYTEEELVAYFLRYGEIWGAQPKGAAEILHLYVGEGSLRASGSDPIDLRDTDYWMLSGYNRQGGVTATVASFAGINRNTLYPEEAFRVIDTLLEKRNQSNSAVYKYLQGLPVHMDLGTMEAMLHGQYMNEWNLQQFTQLREEINVVKFGTALELVLCDAWRRDAEEEELRENVHESCTKMNMMLAES
ncbi:hypothetical protein [Acutalibacter caecimuris]|uniref:hypothetical protein n=1 Tax=Acutalibacter caecimuris TaxID=3093657 RepID=UPI002AC9C398|nr:hypothetical protein [Acutalibacter sp. M00118]